MSAADNDREARSGYATGYRRAARLGAVQALYQIESNGEAPLGDELERAILDFITIRAGVLLASEEVLEMDEKFFGDLVRGAIRRQPEIDGLLSGALADGWSLARMEAVLRAVLRAAIYELMLRPDVPIKVTINEYVEVARAFFEDDQTKFANAVLDRIAHLVRSGDFTAAPHDRPAENG